MREQLLRALSGLDPVAAECVLRELADDIAAGRARPPVIDAACTARTHNTKHAHKNGCICPGALTARRADRAATRARRPRGASRWRLHRDVDEQVVYLAVGGERTASGDRPQLGVTERTLAIAQLTRDGKSVREICELLHVSHATVTRHRRLMREGGQSSLSVRSLTVAA